MNTTANTINLNYCLQSYFGPPATIRNESQIVILFEITGNFNSRWQDDM